MSQSLFYWITYSYNTIRYRAKLIEEVSILILLDYLFLYRRIRILSKKFERGLNPYFIGLPILIFTMIVYLIEKIKGLNPYFIGLPILILCLD